ncbi:uncharacterized protein LOC119369977 [Jatropha curcas]|uniref:uncharacterized protein LOC119369977 n=1 Tax=Jatropha curcas TaxID=180498 RepID=UPI0018930384|nr:uncharacterized protein LOC119369977 [Jatropha curcas]
MGQHCLEGLSQAKFVVLKLLIFFLIFFETDCKILIPNILQDGDGKLSAEELRNCPLSVALDSSISIDEIKSKIPIPNILQVPKGDEDDWFQEFGEEDDGDRTLLLKECFDIFDTNGDGFISGEEHEKRLDSFCIPIDDGKNRSFRRLQKEKDPNFTSW